MTFVSGCRSVHEHKVETPMFSMSVMASRFFEYHACVYNHCKPSCATLVPAITFSLCGVLTFPFGLDPLPVNLIRQLLLLQADLFWLGREAHGLRLILGGSIDQHNE